MPITNPSSSYLPHIAAILCLDFDGTLIDEQVHIHPKDVTILSDFPDTILPVITTGRDLHSVKSILQAHGIYQGIPFPLPGVFMNGGVAYRPGEQVCFVQAFSADSHAALVDLALTFPSTAFTFFGVDTIHLVNPTPFARNLMKAHHLDAQETRPTDLSGEIIKVMVLEPERSSMRMVKRYAQSLPATTATSLPYAFEINPSGITKAATLTRLLETLHLNGCPIFAVGDAENDLPLFQLARTSFTPTTAHPKALESANYLVERNQDGLIGPILEHISSHL